MHIIFFFWKSCWKNLEEEKIPNKRLNKYDIEEVGTIDDIKLYYFLFDAEMV